MSEEKANNGSEVTKQDNQDKKDGDNNKQPLGALFFTLIVVLLKDTALTKEIVIGLLSFIGGGLGFGIGKMQKKD
jgi:hypothetical protein